MFNKSDKEVREALAEVAKNPEQRQALAEFLIEWIQPNHYARDLMEMIMPTRSFNFNDIPVKKIRQGIEVRTLVPGAVHMASEITVQDVANYVLNGADVKVHANLWELESGELGSVQEIRREMEAKLSDFYITRVYNALSNIWSASNTPNNYASGSAVTATLLEDAIDEVTYRMGKAKAVVGARKTLLPITKFGAFWDRGAASNNTFWGSETRINQVLDTGWLGTYYGVPIVGLQQLWKSPIDYTTTIPEDKVLVIGENVGEFITFGEVREKQWNDMNPTPPMWMLEIYQQYGMIVDNASGIYVIKIT